MFLKKIIKKVFAVTTNTLLFVYKKIPFTVQQRFKIRALVQKMLPDFIRNRFMMVASQQRDVVITRLTKEIDELNESNALFNKVKHTTRSENENRDGKVHYSYGVEKYNGWNDSEFIISFIDEKCNRQSFKLHWNGILRIKYEEITVEKMFYYGSR